MNRLFIICLTVSFLTTGCGKPSDPDMIYDSGGYSVISRFLTPGNSQDVVKLDTLLCFAQGEGGLLVINIKDPKNPSIVSVTTQNVRGYSRRIARKENVVYLCAGTFGLSVVDIANPYNPEVTASNLGMKPAKDAYINDNYLFVSTSEQGVKIAEITNPRIPEIKEGPQTNGYANGVVLNTDKTLMFVACGEMGLNIFDISIFDEGYGEYPMVAWIDFPGYAESVVLHDELPLAYIASRSAGVQIIDFSDLNNPRIAATFETGGVANDVSFYNNKLYVSTQKAGLQIIDATHPINLKRIGWVNTKYALGFDFDEDYIYIADDIEGLIIVKIPK
jgi:hypothetical protein